MSQSKVLARRELAPREHFPFLDGNIYLNSAAIGMVPLPVQEKVMEFTRIMGSWGAKGYFDFMGDAGRRARAAAARLFSCRAEDVFFSASISEAISNIAWTLMPGKGKNIVCVDVDIPATTLPWLRIGEETGCVTRFVRVAEDPAALCTEKVIDEIDQDTFAVCISHVQWCTGHLLDIGAICAAAHQRGALVIVDAMHTMGVMPIDVKALDVDVIVAGSYKWMGSYAGVAVTYVRPSLMETLRPALVGASTLDIPPPFTGADPTRLLYTSGTSAFQYGSTSHVSIFSFGFAAEYLLNIGLDSIIEHNRALTQCLLDGLESLGAVPVTPREPRLRAGVLMARLPGRDAMALVRGLEERNIYISCRMEGLRFSPNYFNNGEDIARVLNTLEDMMKG